MRTFALQIPDIQQLFVLCCFMGRLDMPQLADCSLNFTNLPENEFFRLFPDHPLSLKRPWYQVDEIQYFEVSLIFIRISFEYLDHFIDIVNSTDIMRLLCDFMGHEK
jgi:hypothetical protein